MKFPFENNIVLEDKRVRLERLSEEHLVPLLPIAQSQPDLLQYSPSPFGSKDKLNEYIEISFTDFANRTRYAFAIFDKEKQAYAGSTSFGNISNKNQRLEIGWTWIGKNYQRTGLNRHCKFLLLQYAFEQLEWLRVELKTDARNLQSQKAIERIGGTYEGTLRSHTLMNDGHRRDTMYYGILRSEWEGVKNSVFKALV